MNLGTEPILALSQKIKINKVYCDIAEIAKVRNRALGPRGLLAVAGELTGGS